MKIPNKTKINTDMVHTNGLTHRLAATNGYTLVELLVYILMVSIVSMGMYDIFITNTRVYSKQEAIAALAQELRLSINFILRELRMAGCDPTGAGNIGFVNSADDNFNTDANSIHFRMDITNPAGQRPDGLITEPEEDVNYYLYGSPTRLGRRIGNAGVPQPLAENITNLTFRYFGANNNELVPPGLPFDQIRVVAISITGRTPEVVVLTNKRESITITARIKIRNAGL